MQGGQCYNCGHFQGGNTCAAFPHGIPKVILTGENDHSQEFEGDRGLRFISIEDNLKMNKAGLAELDGVLAKYRSK